GNGVGGGHANGAIMVTAGGKAIAIEGLSPAVSAAAQPPLSAVSRSSSRSFSNNSSRDVPPEAAQANGERSGFAGSGGLSGGGGGAGLLSPHPRDKTSRADGVVAPV
ncbi:unnamed protein product, partial [Pylaiella littoralis]